MSIVQQQGGQTLGMQVAPVTIACIALSRGYSFVRDDKEPGKISFSIVAGKDTGLWS